MNSYKKLKCKYEIIMRYNAELQQLIWRMGTNEQNNELQKMIKNYVKKIDAVNTMCYIKNRH